MALKAVATLALSLLTAVAAQPAASAGYFTSGNDLLRKCTADLRTPMGQAARMYCTAYVAGVADSESWLGPELRKAGKTPGICTPARTEAGQAVEIVTAYLEAHPEERALNASTVVIAALFAAWPCASQAPASH